MFEERKSQQPCTVGLLLRILKHGDTEAQRGPGPTHEHAAGKQVTGMEPRPFHTGWASRSVSPDRGLPSAAPTGVPQLSLVDKVFQDTGSPYECQAQQCPQEPCAKLMKFTRCRLTFKPGAWLFVSRSRRHTMVLVKRSQESRTKDGGLVPAAALTGNKADIQEPHFSANADSRTCLVQETWVRINQEEIMATKSCTEGFLVSKSSTLARDFCA